MKLMMNQKLLSSIAMVLFSAALISGCASKKKASDQAVTPPTHDDVAMSFDPVGSDSMKIEGLHTIHFLFDKSVLDKKEKDLLQANAEWMKKYPLVKIQIEGHCDARGSIEYNLALGERRAKMAMEYLNNLGIAADRLSIISYGKEKPISNGDSEDEYAKNRRDNFVPLKN